ncbi:MAG: hypothetical protein ACFCD0_08230 [Gemmataceae bacterium]
MHKQFPLWMVLIVLVWTPSWVRAQLGVPGGVGGVPGGAGGAAGGAGGLPTSGLTGAVQQPQNLWDFLGLSYDNWEKHQKKLCDKPIGKLIDSMLVPFQFASGGLIHPLCPEEPTEEELAALTDPDANVSPAEAAAASIKADVAGAAKRRAAVRYLGTVDCHYYPEAENGLIGALRGDRIECVRYEAALALAKGCCCTKKTIAALTIVVEGKDTDGNPAETSERVKSMAHQALNLCLSKVPQEEPEPKRPEFPGEPRIPPRPENPPIEKLSGWKKKQAIQLAYYKRKMPVSSRSELERRAALALAARVGTGHSAAQRINTSNSIFGIWQQAVKAENIKEEISFDEAALTRTTRPNPSPRHKLSSVQKSKQNKSGEQSALVRHHRKTNRRPEANTARTVQTSVPRRKHTVPDRTKTQSLRQATSPSPIPWSVRNAPEPEPTFSFWKPSLTKTAQEFLAPARTQKTQRSGVLDKETMTRRVPTPVPWPVGEPIRPTNFSVASSSPKSISNVDYTTPKPVPWPGGNRQEPSKLASTNLALPIFGLGSPKTAHHVEEMREHLPQSQPRGRPVPWPGGESAVGRKTSRGLWSAKIGWANVGKKSQVMTASVSEPVTPPRLGFDDPASQSQDIEVLPISVSVRSDGSPVGSTHEVDRSLRNFARVPPVVSLHGGDARLIGGQ